MPTQGEFFEAPEIVLSPSEDRIDSARMEEVIEEEPKKEMAIAAAATSQQPAQPKRAMKDLSIPKLYYSISEVSRLTGLEPYVLRYWETEFDDLRPQKNRAGNRIYSNRDIKFILRIKELLREQRYTIEGAKAILKTERFDGKAIEETVPVNDPNQIVLDPNPAAPQAAITLEEVRAIKQALTELRAIFVK